MSGAEAVALVVLVAMLLALVTISWRLVRWFFRTRRLLGFRATIDDLVDRSEAVLGPICERVDAVRRFSLDGEELLPELERAQQAAGLLVSEARAIRSPLGTQQISRTIADELERAGRALDMVEHGCRLMGSNRGRQHDPEAQTSVKRGYLNLLHSREAIAAQAATIGALVEVPRLFAGRTAD